MVKRITAVFLLLALLLTGLCGCSTGQELTPAQYRDELESIYNGVLGSYRAIMDVVIEKDGALAVGDLTDFDKNCEKYLDSLSAIKKIDPPKKYEARHNALARTLDTMRGYADAVKEYTKCTTEEQFEQAAEKLRELADSRDFFLEQYFNLMSELDEDIGA